MDDDGRYRDGRSDFVRGAKDIAKVAKKQVGKKMGRGVDKMTDEYTKRSYKRFEEEDDDDYAAVQGNDGGYYRNDSRANDDEGHSDSTEGHDEDDEIYEGEYQGIPRAESGKAGSMDGATAAQAQQFRDLSAYESERRKDQEELAEQYEAILQECGHGKFQWTLYFVLGLALMADGVEIFVVGFVLPSAEKDMCLSEPNKGMLGLIVYLGMMVGAFVWGGLADRIGRRQTLLISLSINSVFAFFSSFVQGYVSFLFCRLASGVGIGGSIPIVFSYYSEFLAQEKRGEHLSWLCMFWMIGGIYASAMAWAIIPHYGWSFQMGSAYQFHSWRVFVMVCALPSVAAISALTTMPESPRFYLENGKHDEAWMILKQVHDTNMRAKGYPERVFSVTTIKTVKQMDELVNMGDSVAWHQRWKLKLTTLFQQVWSNFLSIFSPEYRRTTYMMMAVWFSMSFSYYGLTVWFPDMIKYLQKQEYSSRTKVFLKERVDHVTFNFTLENQVHRQGQYFNDKFMNLKMKSMVFEDSLFEECYFEDITSSNTFFKNCTFIATLFYNTDLFKYRLINSKLINSTFLHNKEGCLLSDVSDDNNAYMVYFVSFLGTLAVLPGNIVSALLMDKIGRLRMLAGSSVISCISCFFLSFGNSESAMIALLCLFGGISIASWNALDVLTVELYPSDKRTTAFGFLNALCKLAAVLGISIFTSFVGITKAVPILFASGALAAGSFLALKLPETRGQVVSSHILLMLPGVLRCARPAFTSLALNRPLAHFRPHMDPDSSRPVERAITTKLTAALKPDHLEVHNESHMHAVPPGSESHFRVLVVSSQFDGLPLIKRHRLVNEALKEELSGCVHALSIQAKTPEQWGSNPTLAKSPPCMGGSRGDHTVQEKLKAGRE
ncbi:putative synaptic vesicle glycoprotein 2A [Scophthalmus maximus]|uniref:BolA-like protein 1 n=2 Tax=Scophthalmus maximus TaxID=52904 RepID=A0A2U9CIP1_SCOMX|nr:putative synaptic vesicle glycoprotein 2A [Scophthalmus maximus]